MTRHNGDQVSSMVSLREYVDLQDKDQRDFFENKIQAMEKASDLASDNVKYRLDSLNEWRGQNKDEREMYLSRAEYEAKHEILCQKIESVQKFMWVLMGAIAVLEFLLKFIK